MTWRDTYKVHPAADVFPMLSDDEMRKLGEDIKANGLKTPIRYYTDRKLKVLIDGRNRLEASERVGYEPREWEVVCVGAAPFDAARWVISLNIRRRHLTKQQQADLIVAVHTADDKPRQVGEVSKGGRGKVDEVKAAAVATAEELGIGKRTVERAIAKTVPDEAKRTRQHIKQVLAEPRPPRRPETAQATYGRLLDALERLRQDLSRMCSDLEWLLQDDRWKEAGGKHVNVDAFLAATLGQTPDIWEMLEQRPSIAKLLSGLRKPEQIDAAAAMAAFTEPTISFPELPAFLDRSKTR